MSDHYQGDPGQEQAWEDYLTQRQEYLDYVSTHRVSGPGAEGMYREAGDLPCGRAGEPGYVMPLLEKDALTRVVHVWSEPEPEPERDFEAGG